MKLTTGLMVAAMFAPAAAFAHGSTSDADDYNSNTNTQVQDQAGMGQSGSQSDSSSIQGTNETGTLHGTVTSVDVGDGIAKVKTADKTVKLFGSPDELASLQTGQEQDISYSKFGNFLWINQGAGQGLSGAQGSSANTQGSSSASSSTAQSQQFQGKVVKLDAEKGKLTVLSNKQKLFFRVHPQLLQSISSGQQVSGSFTESGGQKWIQQISPSSGAGMSGSQGTSDQGTLNPGSSTDQSGSINSNPSSPSGSDMNGNGSYQNQNSGGSYQDQNTGSSQNSGGATP